MNKKKDSVENSPSRITKIKKITAVKSPINARRRSSDVFNHANKDKIANKDRHGRDNSIGVQQKKRKSGLH